MHPPLGVGLWTTLLEIRAPNVSGAEGLQTLVQGEGFDEADSVLCAGARRLKCKASHSTKSAMEKVMKCAQTGLASKVCQTTSCTCDILSE